MEIEKIIYDTTRSIYSVEDKLRIASLFLFCEKLSAKTFAELLYTNNHVQFIKNINEQFKHYDVDLNIRLNDKNIRDCFNATLKKVKEKEDMNGYYKALYNKDPFALVIDEIVNYDFDVVQFHRMTNRISKQLTLF